MKKVMIFALALSLAACATIMGDKTQLINLNSEPSEAHVTITDETGVKVFAGATPTSVTLAKSDGSYFGGKAYNVIISKSGYKPITVLLSTHANGWYIGGNIIFGGLIGWLIVDPLTGAMYTIKPDAVNAQLKAEGVSGSYTKGTLHVALIEDVPESMHSMLVPLH